MRQSKHRHYALTAAYVVFWTVALWIALPSGCAAGSASVQVKASVPLACEASIEKFEVESLTPLRIEAKVRQSCNSTHELSVTYDPGALSQPEALSMLYGQRLPVESLPGEVKFGTFQFTQSTTELHIFYDGGTLEERQQFSRTIAIALTPQ